VSDPTPGRVACAAALAPSRASAASITTATEAGRGIPNAATTAIVAASRSVHEQAIHANTSRAPRGELNACRTEAT
jgi:hypothetical protein